MSNAAHVATGKPKVGGAIFMAPIGTALPTATDSTLNASFVALGHVSEDGVTNSNSPSSTEFKAWGGTVVATSQDEKTDTFKFKLIESLDVNVLKLVYGDDNVSGTLSTGITVKANATEAEEAEFVIDMLLKGAAKRVVIPRGKVTEIAEIAYKDSELVGYEVTVTAFPDTSENTHYEYIKE